jgi:hypothetical protein
MSEQYREGYTARIKNITMMFFRCTPIPKDIMSSSEEKARNPWDEK